jgi:predicted MPP superfamily phosphohydrolase
MAPMTARQAWAVRRLAMEAEYIATKRYGKSQEEYWFWALTRVAKWGLQCIRQYEQGLRNAEDIVVRDLELHFDTLPEAFDGFTILHLSDLHLDGMPGLEEIVLNRLEGRRFDLCVLTGDYRAALHGPNLAAMNALRRLVSQIEAREGHVGVLGNHDDVHMVEPMERMGIRVLVNEHVVIQRDGQQLQIVGTDDVHYYYTEQSVQALQVAKEAFTVALVHSPELCDAAAAAGVALYLCGHTHGGQICLPGGIPVFRHVRAGRPYYKGVWQHRAMRGVTSSGVGASTIPVRFNTRGELLCLRLRRG